MAKSLVDMTKDELIAQITFDRSRALEFIAEKGMNAEYHEWLIAKEVMKRLEGKANGNKRRGRNKT